MRRGKRSAGRREFDPAPGLDGKHVADDERGQPGPDERQFIAITLWDSLEEPLEWTDTKFVEVLLGTSFGLGPSWVDPEWSQAACRPRRGSRRLRDVLQYTFVTTDENGNQVLVAQGEYDPGGDTYEVGDSVTLPGADGVDTSWKIVRMVPTPYAGVSFYVEPAD
ncbi:MAG: hypothetical protein ACM3QU_13750 [Verrucomicrobiota bacterium]